MEAEHGIDFLNRAMELFLAIDCAPAVDWGVRHATSRFKKIQRALRVSLWAFRNCDRERAFFTSLEQ